MYEQYTDKQIVGMLIPKLNKGVPEINWRTALLYNDRLVKAIATSYRSAYIRGQLGRSFIIGEKKGMRWVPVNGDNIKKGDSVRYIDEKGHKDFPGHYPAKSVIGKVIEVYSYYTCLIQWPKGSTSGGDKWYATWNNLEVLVDGLDEVEPTKAKKWVPATKDNVKVGSKVRMIYKRANKEYRYYYPAVGVEGVVTILDYYSCEVQWPEGAILGCDKHWYRYKRLEVLLCE